MRNGVVYAIAEGKDKSIFIGGAFRFAGGDSANNIAEWDGSFWKKVGNGISSAVRAIAVDSNGYLYAASISNGLEKWDGTSWSSIGLFTSGSTEPVSLLSIVVNKSGNVFIGGQFDYVDGVRVRNIAQWNGSNWSTVGAGGADNIVSVLSIDNSGNIIAGGEFTAIGGDSINCIAKWNGSEWSGFGSGLNGGVGSILSDTSGKLYVGGSFSKAGDKILRNIAFWKDTVWYPMDSGISFSGDLLAADNNNIYAGPGQITGNSNYSIQKWDGQKWQSLGSLGGRIYAMTVDNLGNLYAGGSFSSGDSASNLSSIARWASDKWNPLGSGMIGTVNSLCVEKSGHLLAGGQTLLAGNQHGNLTGLARWVGIGWEEVLNADFIITCMTRDKSGDVYAGGGGLINGTTINGIVKYNGLEWNQVGTGVDAIVHAIVLDDSNNIFVGGDFTVAGGLSVNHIAQWNGTVWSALNTGMDSTVLSLAMDNSGNLYAGGTFTTVSGGDFPTFARYIARWDGSTWAPLGSGKTNYIRALAIDPSGMLYAGSQFDISKWDGAQWENLYDSVRAGTVSASAFSLILDKSGILYAGGNGELLQWDGKTCVRYPVNGTVYALRYDSQNDCLYIGGDFTSAGNKGSCCVAMMKIRQEASIKSMLKHAPLSRLHVAHVANSSIIVVSVSSDMAGADLFFYDISGKLVDKVLKPGSNVVMWRPKASRSGCYIVAARNGKRCRMERFVLR